MTRVRCEKSVRICARPELLQVATVRQSSDLSAHSFPGRRGRAQQMLFCDPYDPPKYIIARK
eukprot:1390005-Prymnesium_polylepis.1